jgi:ATP-dependent helicase/nuclease subunit B
MAATHLKLFNIRSGLPFLDVLVDSILEGRLGLAEDMAKPSVLARTTVYLPTRRAARAFTRQLAARFDGRPLLLPKVVPLADVDEAEMSLIVGDAVAFSDQVPPAIDPLRRRLELTRLVMACGRTVNRQALRLDPLTAPLMPATLADAFGLAGDLAALLDQMQTEGIPFEALLKLDAANFDRLWEVTATFLDVIGQAWPAYLGQEGLSDPATRRNLVLEAERHRLTENTSAGPIIAAGSTGTVPATARLLKVIAGLPHGAVILPGLDMALDEAAWRAIDAETTPAPSHPQFALKHLLGIMAAQRREVCELGSTSHNAGVARAALAQEALRPSATSEAWLSLDTRMSGAQTTEAFMALTAVEADDERIEALAAAIAMREVLEKPGQTAALVTPDRGLAERVAIELQRWGIVADDSAGRSLFRTAAGHLSALILEVVQSDYSPGSILALLNHPMTRLGLSKAAASQAARCLEIGAIRGAALKPGIAGLRAALKDAPERAADSYAPLPRKILNPAGLGDAEIVLANTEIALRPLVEALTCAARDLAGIAKAHRQAFVAVLAFEQDLKGETDSEQPLSPDAQGVLTLFDTIQNAGDTQGLLEHVGNYADIFLALSKESVVAVQGTGHPRLKIWGLLEARLLHADRVVIGGLVEGVWPPATRTDAFLNRPMRQQAGLSSPEQRIGQTAHDFVQAIAAPEVILTRAKKTAGGDTIPSRFWQRLKAVSGENWTAAIARGDHFLQLAGALSQPDRIEPRIRPEPRPLSRLQPVSLSVTEIETLYRDPYAIYARHVLKLDPLEDFVLEPTAADRGTLLHAIIEQFARTYPDQLPADAHGRLLQIGRRCFDEAHDTPEVEAFWWPKFREMAAKFVFWEERRRADLASINTEVFAKHDFGLPDGGQFRLRAKADRIETTRSGRLRIIDFKTGTVPTAKQIEKGFAPQLTLQAALAIRGGYKGIGARPVEQSIYVKLLGKDAELKESPELKDAPTSDTAEQHLEKLLQQIALFRTGALAFVPHRAVEKVGYARPYDQLARVKEWTAAFGDDQGEAE